MALFATRDTLAVADSMFFAPLGEGSSTRITPPGVVPGVSVASMAKYVVDRGGTGLDQDARKARSWIRNGAHRAVLRIRQGPQVLAFSRAPARIAALARTRITSKPQARKRMAVRPPLHGMLASRAGGAQSVAPDVQDFLQQHRGELLELWELKVRATLPSESSLTHEQLEDSLPLFLDSIVEGLRHRAAGGPVHNERSALARVHGGQRQHLGRDIAELVREYGLLYETVTEVAARHAVTLSQQALAALSSCLFTAAAEAVAEFAERAQTSRRHADLQHFSFIAHELRTPLGSARLAWESVRRRLSFEARAVDALSRSLARLSELIDETLASARLAELGRAPRAHFERIDVAMLVNEVAEDARGDAENKQVALVVETTPGLFVRGDPRLSLSAFTNIVRNAIKFTHAQGTVVLRSRRREGRALIEAQDQCGGLPPERAERLFEVFTQANQNRSGFGLGLAIAKQAVEAQGGTITVKNVPHSGCIFVLDLPADDDEP